MKLLHNRIVLSIDLVALDSLHHALRPVSKFKGGDSLLYSVNDRRNRSYEVSRGVSTNRILEKTSQLGLSEGDVRRLVCWVGGQSGLRVLGKLLDYFTQSCQGKIDVSQLKHVLRLHFFILVDFLRASKVSKV